MMLKLEVAEPYFHHRNPHPFTLTFLAPEVEIWPFPLL